MNFIKKVFGAEDDRCIYFYFFDEKDDLEVPRNEMIHRMKQDADLMQGLYQSIVKIAVFRTRSKSNSFGRYHAFVVLQTEDHYYSMERWPTHFSIQRSTRLSDVTTFGSCADITFERGLVAPETPWNAASFGTVMDVILLLRLKKVFKKRYDSLFRNSQNFAETIFKDFSESHCFKKYQKSSKYLPISCQVDTNPWNVFLHFHIWFADSCWHSNCFFFFCDFWIVFCNVSNHHSVWINFVTVNQKEILWDIDEIDQ